jgi:hypothetical protein
VRTEERGCETRVVSQCELESLLSGCVLIVACEGLEYQNVLVCVLGEKKRTEEQEKGE